MHRSHSAAIMAPRWQRGIALLLASCLVVPVSSQPASDAQPPQPDPTKLNEEEPSKKELKHARAVEKTVQAEDSAERQAEHALAHLRARMASLEAQANDQGHIAALLQNVETVAESQVSDNRKQLEAIFELALGELQQAIVADKPPSVLKKLVTNCETAASDLLTVEKTKAAAMEIQFAKLLKGDEKQSEKMGRAVQDAAHDVLKAAHRREKKEFKMGKDELELEHDYKKAVWFSDAVSSEGEGLTLIVEGLVEAFYGRSAIAIQDRTDAIKHVAQRRYDSRMDEIDQVEGNGGNNSTGEGGPKQFRGVATGLGEVLISPLATVIFSALFAMMAIVLAGISAHLRLQSRQARIAPEPLLG